MMLSAFALLAIFVLSSFSTATGPSSTPNATVGINAPDYNGYEATSASNGDGCLEIFYMWTDTMFLYAENSGTEVGDDYREAAALLFAALMICTMQ